MELTKKDLEQYKELDEIFKKRVVDVLNITQEIKTGKSPMIDYDSIEGIEFYKGDIEINIYESSSCSCCSGESTYYSLPEHYIYDLDIEKLKKEVDDDKKEKLRQKLEQEEILKKLQLIEEEKRERELLKKLQEKYSE